MHSLATVLEMWLREFFRDFNDDSKILSMMTNYVNRELTLSGSEKVKKIIETIKELVNLVSRLNL
jgi:spore cortex formation protein SpoVR/YcgB (stage V sporulation)